MHGPPSPTPHPQPSAEATVVALTPAAVLAYLARVESIARVRSTAKLLAADVDAFLGVLHFWALAGGELDSVELSLPDLYSYLGQAKGTVRPALDRLVAVGLLASVKTSSSKSVPTVVEFVAVGAGLEASPFRGQILTPKVETPVAVRGQILTPKQSVEGQILTPTVEPSAVRGQHLTPKQSAPSLQSAQSQPVTTAQNASQAAQVNAVDHYSIISKVGKEESTVPTTKQTKVKRAKKGDADYPPDVVASFENWFRRYGIEGRAVHRAESLAAWGQLTEADRLLADSVTDSFVAEKKDGTDSLGKPADYRPHPERFLKRRDFAAYAEKLAARNKKPTATNGHQPDPTRRQAGRGLAVPTVAGYGLG